jgi:hypothetical protein
MFKNTSEILVGAFPEAVSERSSGMGDGLITAVLLTSSAVITIAWLTGLTWAAGFLWAVL